MGILPAMTSIFRPVGGGQGMRMPTSLPNPLTNRQATGPAQPPTMIAPVEISKLSPWAGGQQQTPITTPSSPAKPIYSINQGGFPSFLNMLMKSWQPTQTTQDSANPLQQLLASFFGPQGGPGGMGNGMYGQFGGGVPNYMQGLMGILNFLGAPLFTRSMQ